MKVVTYNIHSGIGRKQVQRLGNIADVLSEIDADLIALQEVDCKMLRSGEVDQAHWIAQHLDLHYAYQSMWGREGGRYGIALLSRWPLEVVAQDLYHSTPYWRKLEPRGYILGQVECPFGTLQIISTHLGLTGRERMKQAHELVQMFDAHSHPTILMGDLNCTRSSDCYKFLLEKLDGNEWATPTKEKSVKSFPARRPLMGIDHIITSSELILKNLYTFNSPLARKASDHLPVCGEVELAFTSM